MSIHLELKLVVVTVICDQISSFFQQLHEQGPHNFYIHERLMLRMDLLEQQKLLAIFEGTSSIFLFPSDDFLSVLTFFNGLQSSKANDLLAMSLASSWQHSNILVSLSAVLFSLIGSWLSESFLKHFAHNILPGITLIFNLFKTFVNFQSDFS